jgi:NTP pyrophosphatase (non-canonical NTP hydrolase)
VETNDSNPPRREDLIALRDRLRKFAEDRDWVQFHSPKNLAMALSVEAAELMEHFQWLTEPQSEKLPPETHAEVAAEIADVLIYIIRLADRLDVDLLDSVLEKIANNEHKYPADLVRGRADKYTAYKKGSRSC